MACSPLKEHSPTGKSSRRKMKIQIIKTDQQFKPVVLQITIETQQELERWWALHNHTGVTRFLGVSLTDHLPVARNEDTWHEVQNLVRASNA